MAQQHSQVVQDAAMTFETSSALESFFSSRKSEISSVSKSIDRSREGVDYGHAAPDSFETRRNVTAQIPLQQLM